VSTRRDGLRGGPTLALSSFAGVVRQAQRDSCRSEDPNQDAWARVGTGQRRQNSGSLMPIRQTLPALAAVWRRTDGR
jgi:hypothetical protein